MTPAQHMAAAQEQTEVVIAGQAAQRIPFESSNPAAVCGCCGTGAGMLHCQPCTREVCPRCAGHLIECGCQEAPAVTQ